MTFSTMPIKKFLLISPKNRTVWNFRGELIKEIQSLGYQVIVTGPNKDGLEKIKELGADFRLIPMEKNGLSIVGDIKYIYNLYRLMRKEKPDATLGYTIKPVIYGAVAAKLAGIKNINSMITGAGYVFTSKTRKAKLVRLLVSILYRIGFACSGTVIFQNHDDFEEFTEKGWVKKNKCRLVNGSGVNMEKFVPAPLPKQLTFFMLSRVMFNKGVREYLNAARMVKQKYPDVRFMLLGAVENIQDSMPQEELQEFIDEGTIEYFGETTDIAAYYRQCSVYVLPSYREGTPRTVLEAMATARPIITTNTQGCRETVIDGRNGFLVPVKDSKAVAEKMEWFINNQDKIESMGEESLKLCWEKFDVRKVNEKMINHLQL